MKGIITFHSIDRSRSTLSFPPDEFARFIRALIASPLPICDLDTLLDPQTRQGITITFDDGMESVFTHALPVLKENGVKAHIFLTTSVVGSKNLWPSQLSDAPVFKMLSWAQIEACHSSGIYVENHTVTHPDLRRLSEAEIEAECACADETIRRRLGRPPRYFAYPFGFSNPLVRGVTSSRYRGCVTTKLRSIGDTEDRAELPRIDAYYIKPPWLYRRLNTLSSRAYLSSRSLLRTLRGTQ